jgi:hypothetical protein
MVWGVAWVMVYLREWNLECRSATRKYYAPRSNVMIDFEIFSWLCPVVRWFGNS